MAPRRAQLRKFLDWVAHRQAIGRAYEVVKFEPPAVRDHVQACVPACPVERVQHLTIDLARNLIDRNSRPNAMQPTVPATRIPFATPNLFAQ